MTRDDVLRVILAVLLLASPLLIVWSAWVSFAPGLSLERVIFLVFLRTAGCNCAIAGIVAMIVLMEGIPAWIFGCVLLRRVWKRVWTS